MNPGDHTQEMTDASHQAHAQGRPGKPGGDHLQGQGGHHAHMVADFRRRFWVSLGLTLPILALAPLIPLAAGVLYPLGILLPPAVGALLMSVSTVIVAVNARLLGWRNRASGRQKAAS